MNVLFVSPVPSHPPTQGNATRVLQLGRMLQFLGATVHFVYVQLEGLDSTMRAEMEACWDRFDAVPVNKELRSSVAGHYLLDDWYEPQLDACLRRLFARYDFDAMITTYVWYSRGFLSAPETCLKILDAQDLFGDRQKRLMAHGVAPAWFYTTPEEEARGLARTDCVLAIQDEEAEAFRALTDVPVHVVGHLLPTHFLPRRAAPNRIRVGYIGSSNPTNVDSMRKLCAALTARPALANRFQLVVAGPICDCDIGDDGLLQIERLGRLDDVLDLYSRVDLLINPNVGGSGLKIKSVEALAFGLPLVATVDAMLGLSSDRPEHRCESASDLCDVLQTIDSVGDLTRLAETSREIFLRYQARQLAQLETVYESARRHASSRLAANAMHSRTHA